MLKIPLYLRPPGAGFPIVIYFSCRARRRPDAHIRLTLIATMALVGAAFGNAKTMM